MSKINRTPEKIKPNAFVTTYLVAYNVVQTIGWSLIGLIIGQHLVSNGTYKGMYVSAKDFLQIFQTAAVLEVIHCAIGLVRSNVILTAFQVASRVFLVWGILHSVPDTQDSVGFTMLLLAWTITEIIRYMFYVLTLCKIEAFPLQWLRYTLFIGLYPLGVSGELLCIFNALPKVKTSNLYSLQMPNSYNFAFDYYIFLILAMLTYIPVFPQLYFHMIAQRKKIIGGEKSKTA